MKENAESLSIVVVGGSGNLAKKKIYPALFALYCQGFLPKHTNIFGFARHDLSNEQFRDQISENLICRYTPDHDCEARTDEFLNMCRYVSGQYASADSFLDLYQTLQTVEKSQDTNRLFYLAIPPSIFTETANAIGNAGFVQCDSKHPWSHVVVEKPFGKDRESSDKLVSELANVFEEHQTYRIDHYLGKEVVQNLLVLRFANLIFEPIWNSQFIESVSILWKENLGVEGRGGYFDQYGIIRDVIQNHLTQIVSLIAMDTPAKLTPTAIALEKATVLRSIKPLKLDDIVIGQYSEGKRGNTVIPAYVNDDTVADNSLTPTYASTTLTIDNDRWNGVPFTITAGKGLDEPLTEIRIKFRHLENCIFCQNGTCPEANELILRIQPDEAVNLRLTNKTPGTGMKFASEDLDLKYQQAFDQVIPDAYESLLLDVIEGDRSLFITKDELETAWDIYTPLLHQIENDNIKPILYPFGSQGPESKKDL